MALPTACSPWGVNRPTVCNCMEPNVLNFSNPSRSYDETRHGVLFWGYDQTFEISFFIEADALAKIGSTTLEEEELRLQSFDANRERIHEVATSVYSKRRKDSYIFSYTLTCADC